MRNPLERIRKLIPLLPDKDASICSRYLDKRDFGSILEIVESDIYKARKRNPSDMPDDYLSILRELRCELQTYMSYLYIPDYDDYDYY